MKNTPFRIFFRSANSTHLSNNTLKKTTNQLYEVVSLFSFETSSPLVLSG